jgi:hypothetical protein
MTAIWELHTTASTFASALILGQVTLPNALQEPKEFGARFWDSTEIVRILAKFIYFGDVRNEFYASNSENSLN